MNNFQPFPDAQSVAAGHVGAFRTVLADILTDLPCVATSKNGSVDFIGSNNNLLSRLASHADVGIQVLLQGLSAVGSLSARAHPDLEPDDTAWETSESLAVLQVELSELALMLIKLKERCRDALARH